MANELNEILGKIKKLAKRYYALTGKPVGVTGEVAEYEAARILKLKLSVARAPGCDASKGGVRYQIKGKCKYSRKKPSGMLGKFSKSGKWHYALMVILDDCLEATEIYKAARKDIEAALKKKGSKARNERRQLSVSKFRSLAGGIPIWKRP